MRSAHAVARLSLYRQGRADLIPTDNSVKRIARTIVTARISQSWRYNTYVIDLDQKGVPAARLKWSFAWRLSFPTRPVLRGWLVGIDALTLTLVITAATTRTLVAVNAFFTESPGANSRNTRQDSWRGLLIEEPPHKNRTDNGRCLLSATTQRFLGKSTTRTNSITSTPTLLASNARSARLLDPYEPRGALLNLVAIALGKLRACRRNILRLSTVHLIGSLDFIRHLAPRTLPRGLPAAGR